MSSTDNFLYQPRDYREIRIWNDITPEQWNSGEWQLKNAIRSVDQLKEVIDLTP